MIESYMAFSSSLSRNFLVSSFFWVIMYINLFFVQPFHQMFHFKHFLSCYFSKLTFNVWEWLNFPASTLLTFPYFTFIYIFVISNILKDFFVHKYFCQRVRSNSVILNIPKNLHKWYINLLSNVWRIHLFKWIITESLQCVRNSTKSWKWYKELLPWVHNFKK